MRQKEYRMFCRLNNLIEVIKFPVLLVCYDALRNEGNHGFVKWSMQKSVNDFNKWSNKRKAFRCEQHTVESDRWKRKAYEYMCTLYAACIPYNRYETLKYMRECESVCLMKSPHGYSNCVCMCLHVTKLSNKEFQKQQMKHKRKRWNQPHTHGQPDDMRSNKQTEAK